jgi:nitrate/nitrite transporter NarK
MLGISTEMRAQVPYGVKLRAYLGAGVSASDALSDAFMINEFYEMGETGTANGLLAMVGANVAYQMLIVYIQTHGLKKNKWKTALFEMLTVISFVKPGVDAHRVASGAEQLPGAAVGPLAEMIMIKCGELMFEAIPG